MGEIATRHAVVTVTLLAVLVAAHREDAIPSELGCYIWVEGKGTVKDRRYREEPSPLEGIKVSIWDAITGRAMSVDFSSYFGEFTLKDLYCYCTPVQGDIDPHAMISLAPSGGIVSATQMPDLYLFFEKEGYRDAYLHLQSYQTSSADVVCETSFEVEMTPEVCAATGEIRSESPGCRVRRVTSEGPVPAGMVQVCSTILLRLSEPCFTDLLYLRGWGRDNLRLRPPQSGC